LKRFAYIDAMRGYAVLGVIAVHVVSAAPISDGILKTLLEQGARGVQLFYVTSAFTLTMSWLTRRDGAGPFFVRRFFRIAPMYWLAIPAYLAFAGLGPGFWAPETVSFPQIASTATFSAMLYPFAGSTIVPGGWTVTTEIAFYLLFPLFMMFIRSRTIAVLALAASILIAIRTFPSSIAFLERFGGEHSLVANFAFFWLPTQIPVFMTGIAAFLFSQYLAPPRAVLILLFACAVLALLIIPFAPTVLPNHVEYGLTFGVIIFCLSKDIGQIIVSPAICALGKISYSAYLLHFLVFDFLYLARSSGIDPFGMAITGSAWRLVPLLIVVAALTAAGSTITYFLVERPMIRIGETLACRKARWLIDAVLDDGKDAAA
jgi:exopolysaccharide production protein ExoZ